MTDYQPPNPNHVSHTTNDVNVWLNGLRKKSEKSKKDPKAITWLFERFSIIWGSKWDSKYDQKPELIAEEWTDALAGLSRQAIKQGLSKTRQTLTWPPTIAEFLQACQGAEISQETQASYFMCKVPGCPDVGTMCRATHGNNWVCNRHYHEGKG